MKPTLKKTLTLKCIGYQIDNYHFQLLNEREFEIYCLMI